MTSIIILQGKQWELGKLDSFPTFATGSLCIVREVL